MEGKRIFTTQKLPLIEHLSDEELNKLIDEYYLGENQIVLSEKYNIKTSGNIIKLFPEVVLDSFCIYCKTVKIHGKLISRKTPKFSSAWEYGRCPNCGHKEGAKFCYCINCERGNVIIQKERNDKRDSIQLNEYRSQNNSLDISFLTVQERIFIGALFKAGYFDDLTQIRFDYNYSNPFTSTTQLFIEIITNLIERKIIGISSDIKYEPFFQTSKPDFFNNGRTKIYFLNIKGIETSELKMEISCPKIDIKQNTSALIEIWRKINIDESKTLLQYCLKYVDFPCNVLEESENIFLLFWEYFSISQVFGLLDRCLGYATKEYQAGKISKTDAGGYLLKQFKFQAERAVSKNWKLSSYFRPREIPESSLSKFFFQEIIGQKDGWFNLVPNSILKEWK